MRTRFPTHLILVALLVTLSNIGGSVHWSPILRAADPVVIEGATFDPYTAPVVEVPVMESRWGIDILPDGLIYRPYLAGPKESRTAVQFAWNDRDGWNYDSTIGGQWGIFRIGTEDPFFPQGIQLDFEASAQFRHQNFVLLDILSSDVRVGVPLTFSRNNHQTKFAAYFMRSQPTDLLLPQLPNFGNGEFFQRQSLVLGHSIYMTRRIRIYGEVGYALRSKVSEQWEVQFGAEYAPVLPTKFFGSPFIAANAYLREEVNFGGTFTLQAGWSWRNKHGRLLRIGGHYSNGMSNQFVFQDKSEQQLGFGIWHDF